MLQVHSAYGPPLLVLGALLAAWHCVMGPALCSLLSSVLCPLLPVLLQNTCISKANYRPFIALLISYNIMLLTQVRTAHSLRLAACSPQPQGERRVLGCDRLPLERAACTSWASARPAPRPLGTWRCGCF